MTKFTFVAAALVAAAAYATEASAARSNVASRQTPAATNAVTNCVRAPSVGAYATAPYSAPPCRPNAAN